MKRLAASFEIAGRELRTSPPDRRAVVLAVVREYREWMRHAAGMHTLDTWYAHMKISHMLDWIRTEVKEERLGKKEGREERSPDVAKARTRDSTRAFSKLTAEINGEPSVVGDPPLIVPIEDLVLPRDNARGHREIYAPVSPLIPPDAHARASSCGGVPLCPHGA